MPRYELTVAIADWNHHLGGCNTCQRGVVTKTVCPDGSNRWAAIEREITALQDQS